MKRILKMKANENKTGIVTYKLNANFNWEGKKNMEFYNLYHKDLELFYILPYTKTAVKRKFSICFDVGMFANQYKKTDTNADL